MRATISALILGVFASIAVAGGLSSKETKRIQEAATVLKEIHGVPDKDIPQELWDNGEWGAPVFMQVGKGSWGLQIGAQSIDLVLLVMNKSGMEKMLKNKVSLGAEISLAAGPVGRDARAATDAQMKAEILSYSRTQGLFAGINLSGGVVRPDEDDNADLYGKSISARDVVMGGTAKAPAVTEPFMTALRRK